MRVAQLGWTKLYRSAPLATANMVAMIWNLLLENPSTRTPKHQIRPCTDIEVENGIEYIKHPPQPPDRNLTANVSLLASETTFNVHKNRQSIFTSIWFFFF